MSQALRKLTATIGKSRTILIFINQIRMKIGIMFGNPETTTGGNALKFYASVRLDVRKFETIEGSGDEDALGNRVRVKVVKNKVAPPFRKAELEIIFGKGISATASLLDAAIKYNIIEKKGAWFSSGEDKIAQGRENAKKYLDENPAYASEVEQKLRKIMFPGREFPQQGKAAPAAKTPAATPASTAAASDPAPATDDVPESAHTEVSAAAKATPSAAPAAPSSSGLAAAAASTIAAQAASNAPAGISLGTPPGTAAPTGTGRPRGRPPLNKPAVPPPANETISIGKKPGKGDDDLF
jgi:recombination protein RecA